MNENTKLKLNVRSKINNSRFTNVVKDIKEINGLEIPNCTDERVFDMLNQYYSKEEYQLKCILGILKDLKKSKIDYRSTKIRVFPQISFSCTFSLALIHWVPLILP